MRREDGGLFSLNFATMSVPMMTIAIIMMNSLSSSLI
mgnify:CR=1 FL=1